MKLLCPRCNCEMVKHRIGQLGPTIEVDHCLRCGGTWFDRGEYETLMEQTEALVKGANP